MTLEFLYFSVEVPVAFSTRLTENIGINDSPVIFDVVDLNIGDGYDEFTGMSASLLLILWQTNVTGSVITNDVKYYNFTHALDEMSDMLLDLVLTMNLT